MPQFLKVELADLPYVICDDQRSLENAIEVLTGWYEILLANGQPETIRISVVEMTQEEFNALEPIDEIL